MSEALNEEAVNDLDNESSEELDGSTLPSEQEELKAVLDKFQVTEEVQQKYFKSGKFLGRFEGIEGVAEALKSVEDKYSAVMRDIKSGKYQEVDAQSSDESQEDSVDTTELAQPLIKEYVDNGMELTDELLAKAVEQGLDVRDVKLAAIEMKEYITGLYDSVGGKDTYDAVMAWGKENLSEAERKAFDRDLDNGAGKWAIKGLYSEYKAQLGSDAQPQRIQGDGNASVGIKPYTSQAEIIRDRNYLNSVAGRNDQKAIEAHNRRLAATPDSVIYGR